MNLYLTADKLGDWTGGSQVVTNEAAALRELGPCEVWDRSFLEGGCDPWGWDNYAVCQLVGCALMPLPKLCHVYAGCFTETVRFLQSKGCKVCYTVAAHDVDRSRQAHLDLGLDFPYTHLTDPEQFQRYIGGYLNADVVVCPSSVSAATVRRQGRTGRVEVIPHGIDLPKCRRCDGDGQAHGSDRPFEWNENTGYPGLCPICRGGGLLPLKPLPQTFTVGYLGAYGADKGVRALLEAWKRLNYGDAVLLLGGRDSTSPFVGQMYERWGGGGVIFQGWQDNPWDFMDQCSLYVQPSATEGFGIEVLEAMARGRPVVCSTQAGAVDVVAGSGFSFQAGNVRSLAGCIDYYKQHGIKAIERDGARARDAVQDYTWDIVKKRYQALWRELLA